MAKVQTPEDFFNSLSTDIETRDQEIETGTEVELEEEKELVDEDVDLEDEEIEEETEQEEDVETEESEADDTEEEEVEETEQIDEDEEDEVLEFEEDESEDIDTASIAKQLGWEDVKDSKSFVDKYKQEIEKAKKDAFEGLPDNLKEAVEFAKEGGDFMAILDATSVNYDEVSSKDLVRANAEKYFKNEDGSIDDEALEEWLDTKSNAEVLMMGDQIRNQLKADRDVKVAQIKQRSAEEKAKSNRLLKEEIEKIDTIAGVKLRQSDKESLYNDTVSGMAMEELFYENGKLSQSKLAQNLFKVRKFDKAIALAKATSKNEGKREVISKATNSTVKKTGQAPKPEIKKQSPMDMFYEMVSKKR